MRAAVCILLVVLLLAAPCSAVDLQGEQARALNTAGVEAALPEEAEEILGGLSVTDALQPESALQRLGTAAKEKLQSFVHRGIKSAGAMLCVIIMCSVAGTVAGDSVQRYVELGGALAVSAIAVGDVQNFIGLGTQTLHSLSDFSKALLPSLEAAATASGAMTSGAAKYAATALFLDVLVTAAGKIIMPIVYAYMAATVAKAAIGDSALSGAAGLLKWLAGSLITVLMLAFTCYLSLTGVISGTADAATTRLTKTAISTVLPVVGGIVSDAAGTVVAGASILRNAIGVFGLLAVLAVCLSPFLTLGVQYLLYKAAAGVAGVVSGKRISDLIGGIGTAFGMVLGLVGAGALMLFFSVISSVRAVTGT